MATSNILSNIQAIYIFKYMMHATLMSHLPNGRHSYQLVMLIFSYNMQ